MPRFIRRHHRVRQLHLELLEARLPLAFSVVSADVFASGFKLVADFNQPVNPTTIASSDLVVNGAQSANAVNIVDADTVEFSLPTLTAGTHTLSIASGAITDTAGTGLDAFTKSYTVVTTGQYVVNHNPRLQPGNVPLVGYPGSELDRVDVLWQTLTTDVGNQDQFVVGFRPVGGAVWQTASLNDPIDVGEATRVIRSATITGLNWNSNYEYRVRHLRGDVILNQYISSFRTRIAVNDMTPFSFAAYGDSAWAQDPEGVAKGFREVQSRINQVNPAFSVLLGDNVYDIGTYNELDARFSPGLNPEAAAWMAGHIDYLGLGNHDIALDGLGLPTEQNFSVPIPVAGVTAPAQPPASERPEHSFSWDYGSVHFVTFDTNSYTDPARLDGLLKWVVADLNASNARWKIVYGHHPLAGVPDKTEHPGQNYYQQVVNRLKAAGVDLLMTGHSHTYSWTYPLTGQTNGTATYVNHGDDDLFHTGEGLPQLVSGVGGRGVRDVKYEDANGQPFPFVAAGFAGIATPAHPVLARLGFSKIDVTPNMLTVSYVAADDGSIIDAFQLEKEVTQSATFEQGANGYTGIADTLLQQSGPDIDNSAATLLNVDGDTPASTGFDNQTLLKFDNIFGNGVGQIPATARLRSATLQLEVTDGSVNNMNLHRMLSAWTPSDTWNSLTNGIQANGIEAIATPDTSSGTSQVGTLAFNVLPSIQAWKTNPASNHGWVMLPTGNDGVTFHSSEGTVKPKLIVTWADSSTNNPPIAVADSATTNQNVAVVISVLANDIDSDGDQLTVQSTTTPAHGSVVINPNQTVTYTPNTGYSGPDSFSYTVHDGFGGASTATVHVMVTHVAVFQQGLNGYLGTVDTFLHQNTPTTNNGTAASLKVDNDDPSGTGLHAQSLLRFSNLFGNGSGQIPPNATLQSATLQLQVTNGSSNTVNLHRMIANWSDSDTWALLTNGVQNNGLEAAVVVEATSGVVPIGPLSISVLASLQAWQSNPSSNLGWVILPTGTDGVDFNSSEGTTKPRLVVTYIPQTPSVIVDRRVFYNRTTSSTFGDGSGNPINAIDATKQALLPNETTTTANYTNYSRGLNGLVIDIAGPPNLAGISAASFQFATWSSFPDSTPNFITINPTVTVSTFAGGGLNASDRVKLAFDNHAIQNAWLRVTMLADANTGLATNDVFYFGNARFDVTPTSPFPSQQVVINVFDVNGIRARLGQNSGDISNIYDVDRNGVANVFDTNAARANHGVVSLRSFTAPSALQMSVASSNFDSVLADTSWLDALQSNDNKKRQQRRG
jgi:Bacterial Ig domain/Calcineurin-like phosphoesterase